MTAALYHKLATIIICVAVALLTLTVLQSCDGDYFGRPTDAYPSQ